MTTEPTSPPAPPPIRIRELRGADKPRWSELWSGYLAFYEQDLSADATNVIWRRLIDPDDQPYGLVALDAADQVAGLVHYHFHLSTWSPAGYCYLEDLFVDPNSRGSGVGRALIEAVYRVADKRGATRVYWHTHTSNTRAQALYDKVAELTPIVQYRRK